MIRDSERRRDIRRAIRHVLSDIDSQEVDSGPQFSEEGVRQQTEEHM